MQCWLAKSANRQDSKGIHSHHEEKALSSGIRVLLQKAPKTKSEDGTDYWVLPIRTMVWIDGYTKDLKETTLVSRLR
jgi:hypothetical protein